LAKSSSGKQPGLLQKLLWTGLAAGATLAAHRAASKIWTLATGEAPPKKR